MSSDGTPAAPRPDHALPTWAVNSLENGVRHPDARRIWGKLVSIAMSARRRGWTEYQFLDEVWSKDKRITKGHKTFGYWPLTAQLLASVDGNHSRAHRAVQRAWLAAGDNLLAAGTLTTTEEYIEAAIDNAHAWLERLDEVGTNFPTSGKWSPAQRLVMRYVAKSVVKRRNSKVTCPSREVGAATDLDFRTANRTLNSLAKRGLLVKHDGGRHSDRPALWRSAIYSLGVLP